MANPTHIPLTLTINPQPYNQITFIINQQQFHYPIQNGRLVTTNQRLVPKKLNDFCWNFSLYGPTGVVLQDVTHPYLNDEDFKLFMNLILTPEGIPINNPNNRTLFDLEPIFLTFAYYSPPPGYGTDNEPIKLLKQRFVSNILKTQSITPNIQHVPTTKGHSSTLANLTAEEKDEHRRQKQRERNHRHQEKIKMYTQLGALPNNKAKLIGLLKVLNPQIKNLDQYELEQRAVDFLIATGIDPNYS